MKAERLDLPENKANVLFEPVVKEVKFDLPPEEKGDVVAEAEIDSTLAKM